MGGRLKALVGVLLLGAGVVGCSTGSEPSALGTTREELVNDGQQKVVSTTPGDDARFGNAVRLSANLAVVGSSGENGGRGAAFIFERSGPAWVLRQKLSSPDPVGGTVNGGFGASVAVGGNRIVIGSRAVVVPGAAGQGAVYVYEYDGSLATLRQKIPAPAPGTQLYGESLALHGDTLVVGDSRSAHILESSAGVFTETQVLAGATNRQLFSVAVYGNTLIYGFSEPVGSNPFFAADVYVRSGPGQSWQLQQRLVRSGGHALDFFGFRVALEGDTALVGTNDIFENFGRFGGAYVFVRSGSSWTQQQALMASDRASGDRFGDSVALAGELAIVGAPFDDGASGDQGSAYVFARSGTQWTQTRKLIAADARDRDRFGSAVYATGDFVLVGAPNDDVPFRAQGSAYFIRLETPPDPPPPEEPPPGPVCVAGCSVDTHCPGGQYCESGGLCLPQKVRGRACEAEDCREPGCAVCMTGFCVDGFCCDQPCTGNGSACSAVLTGQPNGTCAAALECGGSGSGGSAGVGGSSSGDGGSGGTTGSGTGGNNPGGAAGSGGTGGASAGNGTGGTGGTPIDCVRVALDGDDAAAEASQGATPFRNLQPAIDFADSHRDIATTVCIASGPACGATGDFYAAEGSDFFMRNGISVFGRYESSSWTRCADSVTRLMPRAGRGIVFASDVTTATELNGVDAWAWFAERTAAITVEGARGVKLVEVTMPDRQYFPTALPKVSHGIFIDANSEVSIEQSLVVAPAGATSSVGVSLFRSRLVLENSSVKAWGPATLALQLDDALDVRVLHSTVSAQSVPVNLEVQYAGAVDALGDIGRLVIEDSLIETLGLSDGLGQSALGIGSASTNAEGVELRRNRVYVEGRRNLAGISLVGGGAIVDSNEVECVGFGVGLAVGIQCDGFGDAASCRQIVGNSVTAPSCSGSCAYDSTALIIAGMETLVDSNRVDGGCSSGASYSSAVGLRASGDVRVQNNVLLGATCGAPGQGVQGHGVVVDSTAGNVDLHSNYIDGGRASAGGCLTVGVKLVAGDPILRNNIIVPGSCGASFNLDQGSGAPVPSALSNNDFAPGVSTSKLYRIAGAADPQTIAEVNALPGASENFSALCSYPIEAGSACIDAGTTEGAPDRDIDADARNDGAPDVGPDELPGCTDPDPVQTLLPSDGGPTDTRELSVAISADHALVGPVWYDGTRPGTVYAYTRSAGAWAEQQQIMAPDSTAGDAFGYAVALLGETAVIGAPFKGAPHSFGAAYVYQRGASAWTFAQELVLPDPTSSDILGVSVALDGDTLALGSFRGPYVYRLSGSTWSLEQALPAPNRAVMTVALDGDTLLAGYDCDQSVSSCQGSATVFTRVGTTWSEEQRLVASNGLGDDRFGHAVALVGGMAFVGAPRRNGRQGVVYVFERVGDSWTQRQILEPPPAPFFNAQFGQSVAALEGWLLVGRADAGFSYRLSAGTWQLETSLIPALTGQPAAGAVALSEASALVGIVTATTDVQLRASATVFESCGSTQ